ncbi:MAG: class I SAM-dependent methyltransferase, partial [Planctomycetales bacterium]|nr:class I SAM-dependent methyltransferase [Planctomycetales bacterium]
QHYAAVGKAYGEKHFTDAESEYTKWILDQIAATHPTASTLAEVGAGTCVFASLLGKQLGVTSKVVCYEPVAELLHGATEFDNIEPHCGGAIEFGRDAADNAFDLIFTKDTAHHFAPETLATVHEGFCAKLKPGGRYAMVVRTPPSNDTVPVGECASGKWPHLYTSVQQLIAAMNGVDGWQQVQLTRWEKAVETSVKEWIDGVANQDTWSVFSALTVGEIAATVQELERRFAGNDTFEFLHQYDVAVYEKTQ